MNNTYRAVNLVLDASGGNTIGPCIGALRAGGQLVAYGFIAGSRREPKSTQPSASRPVKMLTRPVGGTTGHFRQFVAST
jgi:NADPH:quinone reductase-like Zn-dependent oxidoreductase